MLFFIRIDLHAGMRVINSNTSHVILYPVQDVGFTYGRIFKYISCYSLSTQAVTVPAPLMYSNTSHVILYPVEPAAPILNSRHSNTSHVILYHGTRFSINQYYRIQIHLMLFFISLRLSIPIRNIHSNTSHVILYQIHRVA